VSFFFKLYSIRNLRLAWKRIRTGQNISYKEYFRPIYDAYSLSLEDNLKSLSESIKQSLYKPTLPQRVMLPKSSGLQRPITLLTLEDQIVFQAIANIYATKLRQRRQLVQSSVACSNRLTSNPSSIFFLEPWQDSYTLFKQRVFRHYLEGYRFVADFDLSAFYETISHDHLAQIFSPRNGHKIFCEFIKYCFRSWTASDYSHGIPQGPIASDFLAECIMLPIDENMEHSFKYVRYVDDIRILGINEVDVQKGVVQLERLCRDRGLIPHSGKYGLRKAKSKDDALGKMPSLKYANDKLSIENNQEEAIKVFLSSLTKRRDGVKEPSRLKYVLFRAEPNEKILCYVLRIMPRHPELIDAFIMYLAKFGQRRKIFNKLLALIELGTPYEYVEGKYLIALCVSGSQKQSESAMSIVLERHKTLSIDSISIKLGIYALLSTSQNIETLRYLYKSLIQERNCIVKAYIITQIKSVFPNDQAFHRLLKINLESIYIEPAIVAAWYVGLFRIDWGMLNVDESKISTIARNVLEGLGVIRRTRTVKPDSLGILISRRFKVLIWPRWKKLLKNDYKHCHRLLVMAEREFDESPSAWMGCMDSFNDLVIRNLLNGLASKYPTTQFPRTVDNRGYLIDYGNLLDPTSYIARQIPILHTNFSNFHKRRNALPTSHAKDKKLKLIVNH